MSDETGNIAAEHETSAKPNWTPEEFEKAFNAFYKDDTHEMQAKRVLALKDPDALKKFLASEYQEWAFTRNEMQTSNIPDLYLHAIKHIKLENLYLYAGGQIAEEIRGATIINPLQEMVNILDEKKQALNQSDIATDEESVINHAARVRGGGSINPVGGSSAFFGRA